MTKSEILSLPASREFDAWLAEHAAGLVWDYSASWWRDKKGSIRHEFKPGYSAYDALELFEKFAPEQDWLLRSAHNGWKIIKVLTSDNGLNFSEVTSAPTIPLAICRAVRLVLEAAHE